MARSFSIKGPARDGAMVMDEGDLTRAVVDRLGRRTGADGNQHAGEIWAVRRGLWRVLEACAPLTVAKHLRKRAGKAQDYSNRGAVGDLRRQVADWLDPPEPTCPGCRRAVTLRHVHRRKRPPRPAPAPGRTVVGAARLAEWQAAMDAWAAERARQVARHLEARREWVRRRREREPGSRRAPLELFGVLAGRGARRVTHGCKALDGAPVSPFPGERRPADLPASRRYDVEVDRDGAVLRDAVREVLGDALFTALAADDGAVRGFVGRPPPEPSNTCTGEVPIRVALGCVGLGLMGRPTTQAVTHSIRTPVAQWDVRIAGDAPPWEWNDSRTCRPPPLFSDDVARRYEHARGSIGTATIVPARVSVPTDSTSASELARAYARSPLIATAWWRFCHVLGRAFESNGRLYLKAQGKYAPAGTVTRADLVQESAGGAIRGLYDYDPARAKVSTYLVGWCRQGMSKAFAERDEVATPAWLRDLRANLERAGVDLRAARLAVEACAAMPPVETASARGLCPGERRVRLHRNARARRQRARELAAAVVAAAVNSRPSPAWDPVADPVLAESLRVEATGDGRHPPSIGVSLFRAWQDGRATLAQIWDARRDDVGETLRAALLDLAGEIERQETAARLLALAAGLVVKMPRPKAKTVRGPDGKRVPAARAKAPKKIPGAPVGVTGAGVLQALRFEEPRRHSLVFGDGDGDGAGSTGETGGNFDPRSREPADAEDPERLLLAAETADAETTALSSLSAALERLRVENPRACEVVRRREGLGELGADGETLAQIAEGLDGDSPRRPLSREEVRRLYNTGVARLRVLVAENGSVDALFAALADNDADDAEDDWSPVPTVPAHMRSPWRSGPLRPADVRTIIAAPRPPPAPTICREVETAAWMRTRNDADAITW